MKVICQRVQHASCTVNNEITGEIRSGLMLLVSFCIEDEHISEETLNKMAKKVANLRIFDDESGVMNKSILDVKEEILSISQFTLYANPYEGNRPSYSNALKGELAYPLYKRFNEILRDKYLINVQEGIFGEQMYLNITCDGPVTIEFEYK